MSEIDIVGLVKELGLSGALIFLVLRHLIPAFDRLTAAVTGYRAEQAQQHAQTRQAAQGACRAPGSTTRAPNGSSLPLALLALLALPVALSGCSSVHDSAVMLRADLGKVRELSRPARNVPADSYDGAWDELEAHAAELEKRTE